MTIKEDSLGFLWILEQVTLGPKITLITTGGWISDFVRDAPITAQISLPQSVWFHPCSLGEVVIEKLYEKL